MDDQLLNYYKDYRNLYTVDLKEIQRLQENFIRERKWERFAASQVFVHLIEELGEVGSHILYEEKYKVQGAGHFGNKDSIETELAQVFNLFLQLCIFADVDLDEAWQKEYKQNLERFDPEVWQDLAKDDH